MREVARAPGSMGNTEFKPLSKIYGRGLVIQYSLVVCGYTRVWDVAIGVRDPMVVSC